MKTKLLFLLTLFLFVGNVFSQTTPNCNLCSSNDFTFQQYYLGDSSGNPLPATCTSGITNAYIWMKVTSSATRYSLWVDYDVKETNPVTNVSTTTHVNDCLYLNQAIPASLIKLGSISWNCGNVLEIQNFSMAWKQQINLNCSFDGPKCICLAPTKVDAPLSIKYSQNNVSCFNGSNGSINISVTGGSAPYIYTWTGTGVNTTSEDQSNLAAGTYSVTAKDSKGTTVSASITISQPASAITATTSQTNVSCFGGTNGSATVNVSGGTSPYTYSWSPSGGTNNTATNLSFGNYTCTIKDANNCELIKNITITQPSALNFTATPTQPKCFGEKGSVVLSTPTGGTGTISFNATATTNLAAGEYTYTATDANGCTKSVTVTINAAPAKVELTATAAPIACFGGTTNVTLNTTGGSGT
ncbi:MAG: hypothetical protein RLZZ540_2304, partial [Bacteroidota bacterium]